MRGRFRIRFGDTDPYGVVYYAAYHRYAHQAVEDFLRSKGIEADYFFRNDSFAMPVVASQGKFKRPVRYPAELSSHTAVVKMGKSSITFRTTFFLEDQEVAKVEITFVCISKEWKPIPVPESIRSALEGK